jgi:hypothetical protein
VFALDALTTTLADRYRVELLVDQHLQSPDRIAQIRDNPRFVALLRRMHLEP